MDDLLQLRLDLDEAITYGNTEYAKRLAQDGLMLAQREKNLGESEYFKGQIEILNESYKRAMEHFDKAVIYNPNDGASYNDRALCMVELGEFDEAFNYFDKGIEVEPDFATIYHNKGWLLNNLGRHDEAIECFEKALVLDSMRAVTYENLADAYINKGDNEKALECYCKAVEVLKPDYIEIKKQLEKRIEEIEKDLKAEG